MEACGRNFLSKARLFSKFFSKTNKTFYVGSAARSYGTSESGELNPDWLYTEQHLELKRSLSKIIDRDINPYVSQWEEEGQFPAHEVFKKLGDAGFLGVCKPEEYGGMGLDYSYSIAVAEELGKIECGAIPMSIGVQTDMATPALARFGSDELKRAFLVPAIKGDYVSCIGVSEPHAGSDVANIRTTAVPKGDDYIINGSKMWITNAFQGDFICLLCNTGEGPMHMNKSLIIVPLKSPGVTLTKRISKMGMRSSDTAEIFFDDVRVPQWHRIGDENMGFMYQMLQFQEERLFGAATSIEGMFKCISDTIEYTRERKAFGRPLLDNQVIHYRLAELETEVEALRSLVYRTTGKYIQGEDATKLASMCKLKAGRLSREVADSCLQYYGGMGFTNDMLISRYFRDLRLLSIGGGADEVMLSIICKYMKTLPKSADLLNRK